MECYNSDTNKGEAQAYSQWQRQRQQKLKNKTVDETTLKAKGKRQGPQQKLKNKTVEETTLKVNKKRKKSNLQDHATNIPNSDTNMELAISSLCSASCKIKHMIPTVIHAPPIFYWGVQKLFDLVKNPSTFQECLKKVSLNFWSLAVSCEH
jgi:hypothetical protein